MTHTCNICGKPPRYQVLVADCYVTVCEECAMVADALRERSHEDPVLR